MKQETFIVKNIGIIRTPYRDKDEAPRQGTFEPESEGRVEVFEDYQPGLKDLEKFSHAILIFYFHRMDEMKLTGIPPMDTEERGIFAIRGPQRPNHLGLTIVRIKEIKGNQIFVRGVDMLDKTPLLDIKPYIKELDGREDAGSGWVKDIMGGDGSE
ncbi:MAG: tRNA (N6-threonylcarbamoyladenosine(37)-N6)-methyltransferase TrmO [Bacteroidales bacterium]